MRKIERDELVLDLGNLDDSELAPYVTITEKRLGEYLKINHFVLSSSGLTALQAACWASGVRPGAEVICDGFFPFAIMAIRNLGAIPVVADIRSDSLTIDVSLVNELITEKTIAIVATATFGIAPCYSDLSEISKRANLTLIEDRAQAFPYGAHCERKPTNTISSYSFQNGKHLSCGQGGGIACKNEESAAMVRRYLALGWYPRLCENGNTDWDGSWRHRESHCLSGRIAPIAAALLCGRLSSFISNQERYLAMVEELIQLCETRFRNVELQLSNSDQSRSSSGSTTGVNCYRFKIESRWRLALIFGTPAEAQKQLQKMQVTGSHAYSPLTPPPTLWPQLCMPHFLPLPITANVLSRLILIPVANCLECEHELQTLVRCSY